MFPSRAQHRYPETLPPGPPPPVIDLTQTRKRRRTAAEVESAILARCDGDPLEGAYQINRHRWQNRQRRLRRRLEDGAFADWLTLNPPPVRVV